MMGVMAYSDVLPLGERRGQQPYDPWREAEHQAYHAYQAQQAQMHQRALQEQQWQMHEHLQQEGYPQEYPEKGRSGEAGAAVARSASSQHSSGSSAQAPSFPDCFAVFMLVNKGAARRVRDPLLASSGSIAAQRSARGMGSPPSPSMTFLRSASSASWPRAMLPRTVTAGGMCMSTPLGSTHSSVQESLAPWAEPGESRGSSQAGGAARGWWGLSRRSTEEERLERLQSQASVSSYGPWVLECLLLQYGPCLGEEALPEEALVQRTARLKALSEELKRLLQELHEALLLARHRRNRHDPSRGGGGHPQSKSRSRARGSRKRILSFGMGILDEKSVEWDAMSTLTGEASTLVGSVANTEGGLRTVKTVVLEPVEDMDLVRVLFCGEVLCTLENGKAAYAPVAADQDPALEGLMDRIVVLAAEFYFSSY